MERLKIVVTGKVQGVGFRYYAKEMATILGVVGWVMNRGDYKVEIDSYGTKTDLEQFLSYIQKGPSSAYVTEVKIEWQEVKSCEFKKFSIAH